MLQWIHCGTAGVEHIMYPEIIKSKVIITNARGIHATPVAEYVLGVMLYLAKQFDSCQDFKNSKNWNQWRLKRKMRISLILDFAYQILDQKLHL